MISKLLKGVPLVVAALITLAAAKPSPRAAVPGECRTACKVNSFGCAGGKHFLSADYTPHEYQDFEHDCLVGTDCSVHIECAVTFAIRTPLDFTKASEAVERATSAEIDKMIAGNPMQFIVNEVEHSVQILGCERTVQANIPISAKQLAELQQLNHQNHP